MTQQAVPEMAVDEPADPSYAIAERDMAIRRGGGMTDERPLISYAEMLAARNANQKMTRYAVAYHPPDKFGRPILGEAVAMPAEKDMKWIGQGYSPVAYTFVEPPPPRSWAPSAVEDAIEKELPVPQGMEPAGYLGDVFVLPAARIVDAPPAYVAPEQSETAPPPEFRLQRVTPPGPPAEQPVAPTALEAEKVGMTELAPADTPELFRCESPGCSRFFDSAPARNGHQTSHSSGKDAEKAIEAAVTAPDDEPASDQAEE